MSTCLFASNNSAVRRFGLEGYSTQSEYSSPPCFCLQNIPRVLYSVTEYYIGKYTFSFLKKIMNSLEIISGLTQIG